MKAFRVNSVGKIIEQEIDKFGDKSVFWTDEKGSKQRELIQTYFSNWFKTKQEAYEFLVAKSNDKIRRLENNLQDEKEHLAKIINDYSN